jgi:DNA mismatch repair ATPase MutS
MQKIHNYLFKFKKYLAFSIDLMNYHSKKTSLLLNYADFDKDVNYNIQILNDLYNKINKITPFQLSFSKITEIGNIMHTFYELYDNEIFNNTLLYSFGFNGYFSILTNCNNNLIHNKICKTQFIKKGKPIFKEMYYPKFIEESEFKIIKNNCNLNKNMIISGPNASGKTTTLKSVLINIILSQQIGFGCFESLKMIPYDNIHCYLNIPDTSGRDSLFQAEARRCKEILDSIKNNCKEETHFCIFDELYSGTNPEEAVISACAFLDYIGKNKNVTCLLTTHYTKLCKKLNKNEFIQNYHMKTLKKNDQIEYTYLLKKGISRIKGGLKVLQDMNYPQEILDTTKHFTK